ncbi:hypothetical protein QYM36_001807 [Artemia franciscana]|uniref:Uncharacterized protein n=1 Tax=Artemia franciscana TaxID=6661 RepID=A0AA88LE87_ARTSF|nr:hypothetical protein QYM36_001807 [Artemia franciscana]
MSSRDESLISLGATIPFRLLTKADVGSKSHSPSSSLSVSFMKILEKCDEKQIKLPRYAIIEPDEVLIIPGEVSAGLISKVNGLRVKLGNFITTNCVTDKMPIVDNPKMSMQFKPAYAVVLQNPPKELSDPCKRKHFSHNICGFLSTSLTKLKPRKDSLRLLFRDRSLADSLADTIKSEDESQEPQMNLSSIVSLDTIQEISIKKREKA